MLALISRNAGFNYCLTIFDASLPIRTVRRREILYLTHLIGKYRARLSESLLFGFNGTEGGWRERGRGERQACETDILETTLNYRSTSYRVAFRQQIRRLEKNTPCYLSFFNAILFILRI